MNRKFFVLTGIAIAIIALFLAFRNNKSVVTTRPPVIVRVAPTVALKQPENVVFSFATQPALPSTLPTYTATSYIPDQLIEGVLKNLSFYAIPASSSSLLRNGTNTVTWSRDGADFSTTISKSSTTIVFHQSKALVRPQGVIDPTSAASQFITSILSLPTGVSLSQTQIIDGPFDGLLVLDSFGASKFQAINFSFTISGVPITTTRGGLVSCSVVIDNLGVVRSATLAPPPATVISGESTRLISKADIISNLTHLRGSIVSGYNPKTAGQSDALTFRSFVIDKTTVVYGQQDDKMLPAFLLHGVGVDSVGTSQEATYFLWATP